MVVLAGAVLAVLLGFAILAQPTEAAGKKLSADWVSVKEECSYTGKAVCPAPKIVDGNGRKLKANTDYTVAYSDNMAPGTASLTVKGKGSYSGSVKKKFKIMLAGKPLSSVKAGEDGGLIIKWKRGLGAADGYQMQISETADFSTIAYKRTFTENGSSYATCTAKPQKGLKPSTVYYVRLRTYVRIGAKTYASKWSKAKTAETADSCFSEADDKGQEGLAGTNHSLSIAMVGDSITWGQEGDSVRQTQHPIPEQVSSYLGITCDNYGNRSMGYCNVAHGYNVLQRLQAMDLSKYNTVMLCGCVNNDIKRNYPDGMGDEATGTTLGNYRQCLEYLRSQFPNITVIVIPAFSFRNVTGQKLGIYSRMEAIADEYAAIYIDPSASPINDGIGIEAWEPSHPPAEVYAVLGKWLSDKLKDLLKLT